MSEQVEFQAKPAVRKLYIKPEIIHELKLETRAGSPIGAPPFDPTNPFLPPPVSNILHFTIALTG